MNKDSYSIFSTRIISVGNKEVSATLVSPNLKELRNKYGTLNLNIINEASQTSNALSTNFIYKVDQKLPFNDNYFNYNGFNLYSEKLKKLLEEFNVKHTSFKVDIVDLNGNILPDKKYFLLEFMEPVVDAMDAKESGWNGDSDAGIPKLILDISKCKNLPIFVLDKIFVTLMRNDLREALYKNNITGFCFLDPENFKSGNYGLPPKFTD